MYQVPNPRELSKILLFQFWQTTLELHCLHTIQNIHFHKRYTFSFKLNEGKLRSFFRLCAWKLLAQKFILKTLWVKILSWNRNFFFFYHYKNTFSCLLYWVVMYLVLVCVLFSVKSCSSALDFVSFATKSLGKIRNLDSNISKPTTSKWAFYLQSIIPLTGKHTYISKKEKITMKLRNENWKIKGKKRE